MRVNIVVEHGDTHWIGGRMARELCDRLPEHGVIAAINGKGQYDLTYHQIVYSTPQAHPAVGLFTHGETRPHMFASSYDGQICMNPVMLRYLYEGGAEKPALIRQAVTDDFVGKKQLVFGVAGRVYGDGRKGEHLVAKMLEHGYKVMVWGYGWPIESFSYDVADLPLFYRSIDYYVDTSSDEGGCTPALEAMAMGVPVISHAVGVDRPILAYQTHDWDSLQEVLKHLTIPQTYANWTLEHVSYFKNVLERVGATV